MFMYRLSNVIVVTYFVTFYAKLTRLLRSSRKQAYVLPLFLILYFVVSFSDFSQSAVVSTSMGPILATFKVGRTMAVDK